MKFCVKTFGCRTNQSETENLAENLSQRGFIYSEKNPDFWLLNSCAVTAKAERKVWQVIRQLKRKNADTRIIVVGCGARVGDQDQLKMAGADFIIPELSKVIDWICVNLPPKNFDSSKSIFPRRTRSIIKIQEGCNSFCAYCIIPYARGRERSVSLSTILQEVKAVEDRGIREIVLTGTHLANWGKDMPVKRDLKFLVKTILRHTGLVRLRLSSIEPQDFDKSFIALLAHPRLCPHLHISAQSGSDTVLRRMGRKTSSRGFLNLLANIRKLMPAIAITTDIIVGFPGETDQEFEETSAFIRQAQFAKIHIFPFSRRPGTVADQMPGQISALVKKQRVVKLNLLAGQLRQKYRQKFVGKKLDVLFEKSEDGYWRGTSGNYLQVKVKAANYLGGQIATVLIQKEVDDFLQGKVI